MKKKVCVQMDDREGVLEYSQSFPDLVEAWFAVIDVVFELAEVYAPTREDCFFMNSQDMVHALFSAVAWAGVADDAPTVFFVVSSNPQAVSIIRDTVSVQFMYLPEEEQHLQWDVLISVPYVIVDESWSELMEDFDEGGEDYGSA